MLFEFLHLLESLLFQVAERSTTCSSMGVTLRRASLLGVTLRAVCLVTDVDALRYLLRLSVEDDDAPTTGSSRLPPWPSGSGPGSPGLGAAADDHVQLARQNLILFRDSTTPLGGGVGGCRGPASVPGVPGSGITGLAPYQSLA